MDAIAQLLARLAEAIDRRQPEQIANKFTADAQFRGGSPDLLVGPDAIRAMYEQRFSANSQRRTRHLWSNLRTELRGEQEVAYRVTLSVYAFEPQRSATTIQMRVIEAEGICVRGEDGQWLLKTQFSEPFFEVQMPLASPLPAA
ncbi:MAG TPA: nuclear transport factor 2 family protein [Caulobacteraceae bacterium]|jgi:uncharacterized protein (TIGR02246 family)|nr:nuclear transport factor 2 family protein [Caulobacteraceae bacterium]